MHKNPYWLGFLTFIALVVVGYTAFAGVDFYRYWALSKKTEPVAVEWFVKELSPEAFIPVAHYRYKVAGHEYRGRTFFNKRPHLNRLAAEEAIKRLKLEQKRVWYRPDTPGRSTMQKNFPIKKAVYTAILWALLIYFIWLGYHVKKFTP